MKNLLIIILVFLSSCSGNSQSSFQQEVHSLNLNLLTTNQKKKVIGKNFGENERIESQYIGFLKDKYANVFYVVNTILITNKNQSPARTSFVMVYSGKKIFIGYYYLFSSEQLPREV
ncbi:MAG: hypothetical protein KDD63_00935, partial [Bacteroidetes bacterium]|nr:hypothetical protein [Bacteroidota bacterium]